jgi:hypothetical protein
MIRLLSVLPLFASAAVLADAAPVAMRMAAP